MLGIYLCDANSGGLDENEIQFFERIVKDGKKDGRKWVLRQYKTIKKTAKVAVFIYILLDFISYKVYYNTCEGDGMANLKPHQGT